MLCWKAGVAGQAGQQERRVIETSPRALHSMQAATEQAARALALYASEAEELRERLAQAQMDSKGSDMSANFLRSARRLLSRQDSSNASRKEVSFKI